MACCPVACSLCRTYPPDAFARVVSQNAKAELAQSEEANGACEENSAELAQVNEQVREPMSSAGVNGFADIQPLVLKPMRSLRTTVWRRV